MKSSVGCVAACVSSLAFSVAAAQPAVRLQVERDGVYRVSQQQLATAGLDVTLSDAPRLRLRLREAEVPIRVQTTGLPEGSGTFALDFIGRFPRGQKTRENEYNLANIYRLDLAPEGATPARLAPTQPPADGPPARRSSRVALHHEVNRKLMRFSGSQTPDEVWFWDLAMASDTAARKVSVRAERVAPGTRAQLRLRLFGYSSLPAVTPDHVASLTFNGVPLPAARWDGQAAFVLEHTLPAGALRSGENRLGLQVTGAETGGLDVVLLDWVELEYEQLLQLPKDQFAFNAPGLVRLDAAVTAPVAVFNEQAATVQATERRFPRVVGSDDAIGIDAALFAVREPLGYFSPTSISLVRPADLRGELPGSDLVIVTDVAFLEQAQRLAQRREKEALSVRIVTVQDIYENFSGGLLEPEAVRAFLKHAYDTWQPRPRYVLLFGDASWDYKNRNVDDRDYPDHTFMPDAWNVTVPKVPAEQRPGGPLNDRQRVPTFQWQSPWGHAASDLYFACLEGDDALPDVALGRLTVGSLEEARAAVDKLLATPAGRASSRTDPYRALFLTDQYDYHKSQADNLATRAEARGYEIAKIYPTPEERDNIANRSAIRTAFDKGQDLVVFAGHGGRYIWRTGPPDPVKNHDLFTLQDLDELKPVARLPIVVSLTCYSAPFDHPTADSIGEKLMRLEGKGASAIVASSWRNVPPFGLAEYMLAALGQPESPRLGDAFLVAMRKVGQNDSLHTYNLLGDPSMPVDAPAPTAAPAP